MFELIPFGRNAHTVSAYDPFRAFEDLERSFFSGAQVSAFRTDVIDTGDAFRLQSELPGFRKEDINIDIDNDILTITAERKAETEDTNINYVKRERSYGSYSRSFDVSAINVDGIEAEYTDGILTLTMPKKAAEIPSSRRLEIK